MWNSIKKSFDFMGPGTGPFTLGMAGLIFCSLFLSACQKARLEPKGPQSPQVLVQQQDTPPPVEVVPTRRPPEQVTPEDDEEERTVIDRPEIVVVGGDDRDVDVPDIDPNRTRPPSGQNTVTYDDPEDVVDREIRRCNTNCGDPVARPPIAEKCPDPIPVQTMQEVVTYEKMTCIRDIYQHPETSTTLDLDVIFVVDTSPSLYREMDMIVAGFDAYLDNIDEDMNVRIGVVLAHGKLDDQNLRKDNGGNYHGVFYAPNNSPVILSYQGGDRESLKQQLRERLVGIAGYNNGHIPMDDLTDGGEAGMASLNTLLENSEYLQNLDIFRNGAAVHFMFVADENDVCTPGQKPDLQTVNARWRELYPSWFDGAPASYTTEEWAFAVNCPNGFDWKTVASKIEQMSHSNNNKIVATAFTYTSMASANDIIPDDQYYEENEVGLGYTNFVNYFRGSYHDLKDGFDNNFIAQLVAAGRHLVFSINRATQFYLSDKEDADNGIVTGNPVKVYSWTNIGEYDGSNNIPRKCYSLRSASLDCPNVQEVSPAFNPTTQFSPEDRLVTLTPQQVEVGHGIYIKQCNVETFTREGRVYYKWPDGRESDRLDGYMNTVPEAGIQVPAETRDRTGMATEDRGERYVVGTYGFGPCHGQPIYNYGNPAHCDGGTTERGVVLRDGRRGTHYQGLPTQIPSDQRSGVHESYGESRLVSPANGRFVIGGPNF